MAIGTSPNPLIVSTTPDLKAHSWGGIIVDEETGETSKEGVYAGGDAVTGAPRLFSPWKLERRLLKPSMRN